MSTVVPLKPRTRKPADLLQLRIELAGIKPAIWRQSSSRVDHPCKAITSSSASWAGTAGISTNSRSPESDYGNPDPEFDWGVPPRSEQRIQIKTAFAGTKSFK
jgi:hypothetical protein